MNLVSWNVNGIRSCLKKGLKSIISDLNPDILCLQETKADSDTMSNIAKNEFPNFCLYDSSALKKGYSGVSTFIKRELKIQTNGHSRTLDRLYNDKDLDIFVSEGRFSVTTFNDILLYNIYIPSGTSGEHRQELKYVFLDKLLDELKIVEQQGKMVLVCGDFNICHKEIDIHHPKIATQRELTGFLPQERAWMDKLVNSGYIDCFRFKNADVEKIYTWWSYRANSRSKNLGWRIDYFFCTKNLIDKLLNAEIHTKIKGSDHCPVSVQLDLG